MGTNAPDESQALLGANGGRNGYTTVEGGQAPVPRRSADIVEFEPKGDPDNPMDWPIAFKWFIVMLLAAMAFSVTFTCTGVVPVANRIAEELDGKPNKSASVLLVTIWELGEAAGPLFVAPLSEVFGRYPIMNGATILFILATALAALSDSSTMFIAARALTGLSVASNVLSPAIVGDIFPSEQRGSAMSVIMLAPLAGGAVGPLIAGAIAQSLGWRQVVWISAGLAGICELLFLTCFRETYKVPILRKRAARLRAETGNTALRTVFDEDDHKRGIRTMWDSVMRPAIVLFGSGVLLTLSIFGGVAFSYFYIMAVTLADIVEGRYGLSPAAAGSCFMFFSLGSFISVFICNRFLDSIYIRLKDSNGGVGQPEYRLPLAIIGGLTIPLSSLAYGWSAQLLLPLPFVLIALALLGVTLLLAFLPLLAYIVDAFGIYSASAMTGAIVIRCLMGTFLPLAMPPLIGELGYGWGMTVMAAFSLCLAPIPIFILRYGTKWREFSKYSRNA